MSLFENSFTTEDTCSLLRFILKKIHFNQRNMMQFRTLYLQKNNVFSLILVGWKQF